MIPEKNSKKVVKQIPRKVFTFIKVISQWLAWGSLLPQMNRMFQIYDNVVDFDHFWIRHGVKITNVTTSTPHYYTYSIVNEPSSKVYTRPELQAEFNCVDFTELQVAWPDTRGITYTFQDENKGEPFKWEDFVSCFKEKRKLKKVFSQLVKSSTEAMFWISTQTNFNDYCVYYEEDGRLQDLAKDNPLVLQYFFLFPILLYFCVVLIFSSLCCSRGEKNKGKIIFKFFFMLPICGLALTSLVYYYVLFFNSKFSLTILGYWVEEISSYLAIFLTCGKKENKKDNKQEVV